MGTPVGPPHCRGTDTGARPTAGSIPTGWLRTAGPESGGAIERMQ
jgi:hypothetical protein